MTLAYHALSPHMTTQNRVSGAFTDAFDVRDFAEAIGIASDKLYELLKNQDIQGVTLERPQVLMAAAKSLMTDDDNARFDPDRFSEILDLYLRTGIKVNSKGYMARQFSSVVPVSAVFDLVSAMAPQPASFYEAGQLANVADKIMAEELGRLLGWEPGHFDMVTTSGASLANLTAVLVARNRHLAESWNNGVAPTPKGRPAIAIGGDAHFSVSRLGGILGIGQNQVIRLPLNSHRQICIESAVTTLDAAAAQGLDVFCIVAAAGSTAIGANDPLAELAILAKARGAWLHVDAAHNGAFLVSDWLRPRLQGLEMADSFCLDAHKMLFVPALCTLLFYRDCDVAGVAFPQQASYVSEVCEDEISQFQSGMKNFECTKRPAILNLWLIWALFGRHFFEEKLNYLVSLTMSVHDYLKTLHDFEVVHSPESNILCFIYRPIGLPEAQVGCLQQALHKRIRAAGRYFLSMVNIDGTTVLRIVIMNHLICLEDIISMTKEIRKHAREILIEWNDESIVSARNDDDSHQGGK